MKANALNSTKPTKTISKKTNGLMKKPFFEPN